jgi:hypothetical protein
MTPEAMQAIRQRDKEWGHGRKDTQVGRDCRELLAYVDELYTHIERLHAEYECAECQHNRERREAAEARVRELERIAEEASWLPDECPACASKPGAPQLCYQCLAVRKLRGRASAALAKGGELNAAAAPPAADTAGDKTTPPEDPHRG